MNFVERVKIIPYIAPMINKTLKTNLNNKSTSHIKYNKQLNIKHGTFIKSNRMQDKNMLYSIATGKIVETQNGIFYYEVYPELYTMRECRLLQTFLRHVNL